MATRKTSLNRQMLKKYKSPLYALLASALTGWVSLRHPEWLPFVSALGFTA